MKVLVTGACGFIGRHLVGALVGKNIKVTVIEMADGNIFNRFGPDELRFYRGDITRPETLSSIGDEHDVVFHLASCVHGDSADEKEIYNVNVEGTRNILELLKSSVKHFIFFSSIYVYGAVRGELLDEESPVNPLTPYGKSKIEAERLVLEYGKKYGFMTTIFRLPLVYGPGSKGNIHRIMRAVRKGYFVMLGRGENKRSMVAVGNVIDAALSVIGRKEASGKVYIVSDGTDYTVKELYEAIAKALGKSPLPFYIPSGVAKVCALIGDKIGNVLGKTLPFNSGVLDRLTSTLTFSSDRIQREIGFVPGHDLYSTIAETTSWYRQGRK